MNYKKELIENLSNIETEYISIIDHIQHGLTPFEIKHTLKVNHMHRGLCLKFYYVVNFLSFKENHLTITKLFRYFLSDLCNNVLNDEYYAEEDYYKTPPPAYANGNLNETLIALDARLELVRLLIDHINDVKDMKIFEEKIRQ